MKLQARLDNTDHNLEFTERDGKLIVDIDGRHYELASSEPEANVFLLKDKGKVYEALVSPSADNLRYQVRVGTHEFELEIRDLKRLRSSAGIGGDADGMAEIKTAMPGKVVRILKSVGESVAKGEGVIVVEAMKMQNEMRSPKEGVVTSIRVTEGATVGAGEILLVIE